MDDSKTSDQIAKEVTDLNICIILYPPNKTQAKQVADSSRWPKYPRESIGCNLFLTRQRKLGTIISSVVLVGTKPLPEYDLVYLKRNAHDDLIDAFATKECMAVWCIRCN